MQGLVAAIPKLHRLRELHLWGNDLTSSGGKVAALLAIAQVCTPAHLICRRTANGSVRNDARVANSSMTRWYAPLTIKEKEIHGFFILSELS